MTRVTLVIDALLDMAFRCNLYHKQLQDEHVSKMPTESMVFRKYYSDLLASVQTPSELASILYSKSIISRQVRNKAQQMTLTDDEKNRVLFNAVEQAISGDPQCFHQLMDILADESATKSLHTKIMNTYCELAVLYRILYMYAYFVNETCQQKY